MFAANSYAYKIKAAAINVTQITEDASKIIPAKSNVSLNKNWTVTFSSEVDEKTVNGNVKVMDDSTNTYVDVVLNLSADKKALTIQAPVNGYGANKTYSVLVSNNITSALGKSLQQSVKMDFTTAAIKSVDNISDVSTTVGVVPTLPSSVKAVLTDGTTKSFDINWNSISSSDLSSSGTVKLQGTLKGTDYKVYVNINVGSSDNTDEAFLKQFSQDLGSVESKISDSNERNVVVKLKSSIDDKLNNPSTTMNSQPARDAYYALTDSEKSELKSILMANLSFSELLQAYNMFH